MKRVITPIRIDAAGVPHRYCSKCKRKDQPFGYRSGRQSKYLLAYCRGCLSFLSAMWVTQNIERRKKFEREYKREKRALHEERLYEGM